MIPPLADLLRGTGAALGRHPRDPAALATFRDRRVRQLVRHAYARVPFYRRLYERAGVRPETIRGVAALAALPTVGKADLRACPAADTVARGHDPERLILRTTSGSTGEPFWVRMTWWEAQIASAYRFRAMRACGMRPRDRQVVVGYTAPNEPPAPLSLGDVAARFGLFRRAKVDCTAPEQAVGEALLRLQPDVLSGYPSALARVARWLPRQGEPPPRPRFITTDSETLTPQIRQALQATFGAPVFDVYDCWEVNVIAWQCPQHDLLHVCDDAVVLEVLRDGRPAAEGESGEAVITPLFARTSPFIRYRLGDIVTLGPSPCPCGAPFATLRGVAGRIAEYFRLPSGATVHPYEMAGPVWTADWIDRYQFVQQSAAAFVALVLPIGTPDARTVNALQTALTDHGAAYGVTIRLQLVDELAAGPGGKFRVYWPLADSASTADRAP